MAAMAFRRGEYGLSGYQPDDHWSQATHTSKAEKPNLSLQWVFLSLVVGLAAFLLMARVSSFGTAEIAGIMSLSVVLNLRAFWNYRVKSWFFPLSGFWALPNFSLFIFVLMPMQVHESKALINLIWVEFFSFAGLLWLAARLWGDLPD